MLKAGTFFALSPIGIKGGVCFRIMGMLIFWLGVILAVGPFFTSNKYRFLSLSPTKSKQQGQNNMETRKEIAADKKRCASRMPSSRG